MRNPLVSIITPVYNHEQYVSHCIESVLAQSYGNWEQIVVDDGSSDRTPEIVRSYDDPRIRYVPLEHRGLSALAESYNVALSAARGDLVAILEGDDLWPADKLELQLPAFDDERTFLSWGRGALVDDEGRERGERVSVQAARETRSFDHREVFRRLTRINFLTPTVTVMVRRSALDRIGGFKQTGSSLFVDLPTWLWLAATTPGQACFVNAVLGVYRIHHQQTSQRQKSLMDAEHLQVVMEMERLLDPATLRDAGWDSELRSRAFVGGLLVEGAAHLHDRRRRAAAGSFGRALVRADTLRDRTKAALGLLSALTRLDLLTAAHSLRDFAAASIQLRQPRNP